MRGATRAASTSRLRRGNIIDAVAARLEGINPVGGALPVSGVLRMAKTAVVSD